MRRITIRIKGDQTKVETSGFTGEGCMDATRDLTARLGGEILSQVPTPEMYQEPPLAEVEGQ